MLAASLTRELSRICSSKESSTVSVIQGKLHWLTLQQEERNLNVVSYRASINPPYTILYCIWQRDV